MSSSVYDSICVGDEVGLLDRRGNLILGPARLTPDGQMCAIAFGCMIPFAVRNRNRTWVAVRGIKLVQHQPALELA